jgi:bacillithiol synthase
MEVLKIPFSKIPQLSKRDIAYVDENPVLEPFYKYPVRIENFEAIIHSKQKENINRDLLVEVLKEQYEKFERSAEVNKNIQSLASKNTFTIITAHQPSLFTGPLYYVYKIISTINLTKALNTYYPDFQFVPVFITGGEDHDFEEVNHVNIFNKKLVWENNEKGSVGMMKTKFLQKVLAELKDILGTSENGQKIYAEIEQCHTNHEIYSDAVIDLVHRFFKDEGLVVLNMNHAKLKRSFIPFIKEEIIKQPSKILVEQTAEMLSGVGFKQQATAREINFFYLDEQIRERIVFEGGVYKVLNTNLSFTTVEMENEIENHPEHFSPNVIMRPIYQESVLPNLAYIGGGGEIAYWIERKSQFEHFKINFPMLIRRDSVLWIDRNTSKKMEKLKLSVEDIFKDTEILIKEFVKNNAVEDLNLNSQKEEINTIFERIKESAKNIDPTLVGKIEAEQTRAVKTIEQLEARLLKAEKQKHEVEINQIRVLKEKLFPNNGLQERHDNLISFYFKYGGEFFKILKENLNPLDRKFVVIRDN